MQFLIVSKKDCSHAKRYKDIFDIAFPLYRTILLSSNQIYSHDINPGDIVLCFELDYFYKIKKLSDYLHKQNIKFGLFFGDSLQYYEQVYKQYCCLIDFSFTHWLGESAFYETLLGIPSFDHPIFQTNNISHLFDKAKNRNFSERLISFVHLGLIDSRRSARSEMFNSLKSSKFNYKLYGPQSSICEYLETNEINQRLSKCIFGLVPGAASSSNSLSLNNEFIRYQFKGKIWEYMIAGCIPIIDHAPLANKLGLIEGIHFLSVSAFNISEFKRVNNINKDDLRELSNNSFLFAKKKLSIKEFKYDFGIFLNNLNNQKQISRRKLKFRKPKNIDIACFQYSFLRKRFSLELLISFFYFRKIKNIILSFLKNIKLKNF